MRQFQAAGPKGTVLRTGPSKTVPTRVSYTSVPSIVFLKGSQKGDPSSSLPRASSKRGLQDCPKGIPHKTWTAKSAIQDNRQRFSYRGVAILYYARVSCVPKSMRDFRGRMSYRSVPHMTIIPPVTVSCRSLSQQWFLIVTSYTTVLRQCPSRSIVEQGPTRLSFKECPARLSRKIVVGECLTSVFF